MITSFPRTFEQGDLNVTKDVLKTSVFSDVVFVVVVVAGVAIDTKGLFGLGTRAVKTNFIVTSDKLMLRKNNLSESQSLELKSKTLDIPDRPQVMH